jgi:endonuclease/exonuclease/phosphatase family metal-dependent hydrolase
MTRLRIMTMNAGAGAGPDWTDYTMATHLAYIQRVKPDVLLLQELDRGVKRSGGVDQFEILRTQSGLSSGHFVEWHGHEGGQYGIAILSRYPFFNRRDASVEGTRLVVPYKVCPIAVADAYIDERLVRLVSTHFSHDGAEQNTAGAAIAQLIRGDLCVVGGDFNAGDEPYSAVRPIMDRLATVRREAATTQADSSGRCEISNIDHIFVGRSFVIPASQLDCPFVDGRRFTDHPILWADVDLPPRPRPVSHELSVSVTPYPVPRSQWTTVTVTAAAAATGEPVTGEVLFDGNPVGATNTPITVYAERRTERVEDPGGGWTWETYDVTATVRVTGFPDVALDLG